MPVLLFRDAAQNVDRVVCIHVKRHQSAGRWIIFGGICTFCNMLMSKAAKARLPGERRGDGGSKKREGAAWKRGKQTEAGVNYGCNLQFPRGKERQRETSSHAYQIAHLPHFLIMLHEHTRIQSGPCVCVFETENERERIYTSIHVKLRGAARCRQASVEPWCDTFVFSCVDFHRTVGSRRSASRVAACGCSHMACDASHISFQPFTCTRTHRRDCSARRHHVNHATPASVVEQRTMAVISRTGAFQVLKRDVFGLSNILRSHFANAGHSKFSKSERSCPATTSHPLLKSPNSLRE